MSTMFGDIYLTKQIAAIKGLTEFKNNYALVETYDENIRKILKETNNKTNIFATKLYGIRNQYYLQARLRLFFSYNRDVREILEELTQTLPLPYSLKIDAYFLCLTPDASYYIVHPSSNTSMNERWAMYTKENVIGLLDEIGSTDTFTAKVLARHNSIIECHSSRHPGNHGKNYRMPGCCLCFFKSRSRHLFF